jgi:RHS repeat-associated protein
VTGHTLWLMEVSRWRSSYSRHAARDKLHPVDSYTYSTWGIPTTALHNGYPNLGFRFLYVGRHGVAWDNAFGLGLAHMGVRHYSPALGRFLQPDPSALEANLYGYAENSPVTLADPAGTCTLCKVAPGRAAWRPRGGVAGSHVKIPRSSPHGAAAIRRKLAARVEPTRPSESPYWRDLKPWRGKIKTNGKTGKGRRYYTWDHTHGEIEVFDGGGRHLGALDPNGVPVKPPVKGRTLGSEGSGR